MLPPLLSNALLVILQHVLCKIEQGAGVHGCICNCNCCKVWWLRVTQHTDRHHTLQDTTQLIQVHGALDQSPHEGHASNGKRVLAIVATSEPLLEGVVLPNVLFSLFGVVLPNVLFSFVA